MKYHVSATISVDTKTNKILILIDEDQTFDDPVYQRRIAITPVNSRAPDVYVVENDRMGGQFKTATELCRWLSQNLLDRKSIKTLAAKIKSNG